MCGVSCTVHLNLGCFTHFPETIAVTTEEISEHIFPPDNGNGSNTDFDWFFCWDRKAPHSLVIEYGIVLDFTWVWQVIQDSVQKRLHTFVLQCCSNQHWWEESLHCGPADCGLENQKSLHLRNWILFFFSHFCSERYWKESTFVFFFKNDGEIYLSILFFTNLQIGSGWNLFFQEHFPQELICVSDTLNQLLPSFCSLSTKICRYLIKADVLTAEEGKK